MEALVALLVFGLFIASLSALDYEEYSEVVLYKQASDYAQIAMKLGCEHDEACKQELLEKLGRNADSEKCALVERTAVKPGLSQETVVFKLCV